MNRSPNQHTEECMNNKEQINFETNIWSMLHGGAKI